MVTVSLVCIQNAYFDQSSFVSVIGNIWEYINSIDKSKNVFSNGQMVTTYYTIYYKNRLYIVQHSAA